MVCSHHTLISETLGSLSSLWTTNNIRRSTTPGIGHSGPWGEGVLSDYNRCTKRPFVDAWDIDPWSLMMPHKHVRYHRLSDVAQLLFSLYNWV
jgi:hypothetical protein